MGVLRHSGARSVLAALSSATAEASYGVAQKTASTLELPYPSIGRKWMQCRYAPEFDDRGAVQGWVAAVIDVTEQKLAEEALRSRERELLLIYRNVSDVIFLLEVEGADRFRFVSVNRAFVTATGSAGGLGLGLSLVQGLIKLHGGTVTAQSDGVGRGSTLQVTLPLCRMNAGSRP